ncbi:MAG: DNA-binding response regulator [Bacteroidetes bacterium]|nr:MAG: DNA-binding response regulator [Bacteroidota bacterium]
MNAHILLVEDDEHLGYLLKEYLTFKGLEVSWEKDGPAGLEAIRTFPFDLCILDIMMPRMDGYQLAREIRASLPDLPLIFLSARSLKVDVLKGFSLGADDYIKKPVDEEELLARIQAVLARSQRPQTKAGDNTSWTLGQYTFDPGNQQLRYGAQRQSLTGRETALLHYLVQHQGQLCRREDILKAIWGKSDYFNRKSMDVFVSKLRKYLADDPCVQLTNIHGTGFVLDVSDPAAE